LMDFWRSALWTIFFNFSLLFFWTFSHLFKVTFIAKFFLWKSSCIETFTSEVCYRKNTAVGQWILFFIENI
jgi:hypothetical protein